MSLLLQSSSSQTRGYASFEVDAAGDLVPTYQHITVTAHKGETLEAFHMRFRREFGLRPGDQVEILDNGGRLDTVRLKLLPR